MITSEKFGPKQTTRLQFFRATLECGLCFLFNQV